VTEYEDIFDDIYAERGRQVAKFGEQLDVPDGTGSDDDRLVADAQRVVCDNRFRRGVGSYADILREEVAEACAESDKAALRTELLQVATVAIAWMAKLDRELAG
jgi:hypothetical protein